MLTQKANTVEEYIALFPETTQAMLQQIRMVIKNAAPNATETISYGMPAYKQHKMLVYFAGYKEHIGFYPTASGIANFTEAIKMYKNSKGAVQFPLNKKLPVGLITKIVKFRLQEDALKSKKKA